MSLFLRFYPSYLSGFLVLDLRESVCPLCRKLQLEQGVAAVVKESITLYMSLVFLTLRLNVYRPNFAN